MITSYLAKYFAYKLPKRYPSDSLEKLAGAMAGAQVDLNSHQVDAALFPRARRAIEESHTLAALRDALLPKLISSELRVKDVERFVEVVT